jgi:hypothetical protein
MSLENIPGTSPTNGQSSTHDLFALTDEQILDIGDAVSQSNGTANVTPDVAPGFSPASATRDIATEDAALKGGATEEQAARVAHAHTPRESDAGAKASMPLEPPRWLADMMADPQAGGEARDLWNGAQQARQEAAAYREVFPKPEQAKAAAERARLLDEIDRSYFGAAASSPEQASAARTQLAQVMLREDPAAFREMVVAGVKALEEAGQAPAGKSIANAFGRDAKSSAPSPQRSLAPDRATSQPGETLAFRDQVPPEQIAAYSVFEKSVNDDLERSIGSAIERTIAQAVPNTATLKTSGQAGAQRVAPLPERLAGAVRQEVETALQGDRQLGEQVAQVLSARRFDAETRAQIVRLINDRAQQLVPGVAKRVINEWTQATLASHRARNGRTDATNSRRGLEPANGAPSTASSKISQPSSRSTTTNGRVDYNRLSDEQILDL